MSNDNGFAPPRQATSQQNRRIGYPFVPPPTLALDMVRDGRIKLAELGLLTVLMRFTHDNRPSCWTTRGTLAKAASISVSEVRRLLRSLQDAGLIRHVQVPKPDPVDPWNKTGWRFYFIWMDPSKSEELAYKEGLTGEPSVGREGSPASPQSQERDPRRAPSGGSPASPNLSSLEFSFHHHQAEGAMMSDRFAQESQTASPLLTPSYAAESPPLNPELAPLVLAVQADPRSRFAGVTTSTVAEALGKYPALWIRQAIALDWPDGWGGVLKELKAWKAQGGPPKKTEPKIPEYHQVSPELAKYTVFRKPTGFSSSGA